jgi:Protein of unknown function (DUF2750)
LSQAAAQWSSFARDIARSRRLWTLRDAGGFLAPLNADGARAQPFWSTLARVKTIISTVPAYSGFEPVELSWEQFRDVWVPGLTRDGLLVGVNWSGPHATGYDVAPAKVRERVEYEIGRLGSCDV